MESLGAFRDALLRSKALAHVDFTFNTIEPDGAQVLLAALTPVRHDKCPPPIALETYYRICLQENAKILSFQVDASLPADIFTLLNRAPKAEGKKKGKGGKKKK